MAPWDPCFFGGGGGGGGQGKPTNRKFYRQTKKFSGRQHFKSSPPPSTTLTIFRRVSTIGGHAPLPAFICSINYAHMLEWLATCTHRVPIFYSLKSNEKLGMRWKIISRKCYTIWSEQPKNLNNPNFGCFNQ